MNTHQEVRSRPRGTSLWDEPWRKHREKTFFNKIKMAGNARVERGEQLEQPFDREERVQEERVQEERTQVGYEE